MGIKDFPLPTSAQPSQSNQSPEITFVESQNITYMLCVLQFQALQKPRQEPTNGSETAQGQVIPNEAMLKPVSTALVDRHPVIDLPSSLFRVPQNALEYTEQIIKIKWEFIPHIVHSFWALFPTGRGKSSEHIETRILPCASSKILVSPNNYIVSII